MVIDGEDPDDEIQLQIVDLQGRQVLDLSKHRLNKGYNELELDLSELTRGLHLLKIMNGNRTKTFRIYKEL